MKIVHMIHTRLWKPVLARWGDHAVWKCRCRCYRSWTDTWGQHRI